MRKNFTQNLHTAQNECSATLFKQTKKKLLLICYTSSHFVVHTPNFEHYYRHIESLYSFLSLGTEIFFHPFGLGVFNIQPKLCWYSINAYVVVCFFSTVCFFLHQNRNNRKLKKKHTHKIPMYAYAGCAKETVQMYALCCVYLVCM